MSILNKVRFWKKSEPSFGDINLDAPIGEAHEDRTGLAGAGGFGGFPAEQEYPGQTIPPSQEEFGLPPPGLSHRPIPLPTRQVALQTDMLQKDIEIISSKLDALRATLEAINQRLSNIEREVFDRRRGGW